jgi:hypothetical protein
MEYGKLILIMNDITQLFQDYVNVCMPLWNLYFRRQPDDQSGENMLMISDWFADVEGHLFFAIVSRPLLGLASNPRLPRDHEYPYRQPVPWVKIVPHLKGATCLLEEGNMPGNKCWSKEMPFPDDIECLWVDFFDWNSAGYRTYEYLRCVLPVSPIAGYQGQCEALVKFNDVRVLFDSNGIKA